MADTTITSANSVFTITVPGLFPAPVTLHGYAAERAWNTDQQDLAETQMGVDGRMTAGFIPAPVKQTVSLQADSPSKAIFNAIARAMKQAREVFYINGAISLPSTGEAVTCVRGVLTNFKPIPDAGKVLQPLDFAIVWERMDPTLL
jgi:hypothetical protein